jgi:hypothetical protein
VRIYRERERRAGRKREQLLLGIIERTNSGEWRPFNGIEQLWAVLADEDRSTRWYARMEPKAGQSTVPVGQSTADAPPLDPGTQGESP